MDKKAPTSDIDASDAATASSDGAEPPWRRDLWLERIVGWNDVEADTAIRKGLSIDLAMHLQELLDLTDAEAARILGRSRSTYARYRNAGRALGVAEGERAVRVARLIALAADTVGALDKAARWMREANYALGGRVPLIMAETEPGARVVRNLLHGIQHGHPV